MKKKKVKLKKFILSFSISLQASIDNKIWFLNIQLWWWEQFQRTKSIARVFCKFFVYFCVRMGVGVKRNFQKGAFFWRSKNLHGLERGFSTMFTKDYVLIVFLILVLSFQSFAVRMEIIVPQQTFTLSESMVEKGKGVKYVQN